MGIILKRKKVNQKDQVNKGDDTTALILFYELSYLGRKKRLGYLPDGLT